MSSISEIRHMLLRDIKEQNAAAQLLAVSKMQPDDKIEEALATGQRLFGENKIQEAQLRWTARRAMYPDLELHLIGPLQSNKVKEAVALFDVIQTLDREKIAVMIAKESAAQNRKVECYIQVNTGAEDQKAGVRPQDLGGFLELCRSDCHLSVVGLMCIPPQDAPAGLHFAFLKTLADRYQLHGVSMGMSHDYKCALVVGATMIRVGRYLFGERPKLL